MTNKVITLNSRAVRNFWRTAKERRTKMKYGELTLGQIEAMVNKLGGMEKVESLLRGELTISEPTRSWREENGVIRFSVVSDGTTGPEWIKRLEKKGSRLSKWAMDVLKSSDFKSTSGVTYEVGVLKGTLFSENDRVTDKIRLEAVRRKMILPEAEIACLIRGMFTNEEIRKMGLYWIVTMHEPIKDSGGDPGLLSTDGDDVRSWLSAYYGRPVSRWHRGSGFAFCLAS